MSLRPSIVLDFDGTIVDFAYPGIGALKPGVKEAIHTFRRLGYKVIISSCRTCHWDYDVYGGEGVPVRERPAVIDMVKFLEDNEIPYDEIDYGDKGKASGAYYIDDRAIRFQDNWDAIAKHIIKETLG